MDQDLPKPQDPQGENSKPVPPPTPPHAQPAPTPALVPVPHKPQAEDIDINKILLPKKSIPGKTADSAIRINAGVLLEQEQGAELPKTPSAPPIAPAAPRPPKDESVVKAIETYQGDIENVVQHKNVSVVSIAAAEAGRRNTEPASQKTAEQTVNPVVTKTLLVIGGVIFLLTAVAIIIFVTRPKPAVQVVTDAPAPFITVDQTKAFTLPPNLFAHAVFMNALESQRENVSLSLGLIERIYLALPATTSDQTLATLSAQQLLTLLGPDVPDTLLRAVDPNNYLLGIHSYDGNQPLLILHTNSYEQAFSGMLAWEPYMNHDLSPLFTRTPRLHIPEQGTVPSSPTSTPTFIQTGFIDRTVENYEARVIQNDTQDILMLWTFLDRNTVVITTNEATLREIISRLKSTPIVPTP